MKVQSVLLIDDAEEVRLAGKLFLQKMLGWTVTTANGCDEGLKHALASPPDLVLLDLNMPDKDGAATLKELRSHQSLEHVPIVFLTGERHEQEYFIGLGGLGGVEKGIASKLPAALDSLLRHTGHSG